MTAAIAGSRPGRPAGPASTRPYLAPVPDSEPPFDPVDTTLSPAGGGVGRPARTTAAGDGPTVRPPEPDRAGPAGHRSVTCDAVPTWSADRGVGLRRRTATHPPDAMRAAQVFATALVEVLGGRRPVGQLRIHAAPPVFAALVNRTTSALGTPVQLMSMRVCQPADGVAEVGATVRCGPRARAIAFRLEGVDGRWRVTALEIG